MKEPKVSYFVSVCCGCDFHILNKSAKEYKVRDNFNCPTHGLSRVFTSVTYRDFT